MKMLFFSSDASEVQVVYQELLQAGIPCEQRSLGAEEAAAPREQELWILNDQDCHRAWMLCVQQCIGFSRRPNRVTELDELEAFQDNFKATPSLA